MKKRKRNYKAEWKRRSKKSLERKAEKQREKYAESGRMLKDLLTRLGGTCALCEEDGTNAPLSLDHVNGRGWEKPAREYAYDVRVKRYYEEFMRGVPLRVLCKPCNDSYRPPTKEERDAQEACPF